MPDAPLDTFLALLRTAVDDGSLVRFVLARPRGEAASLRKVAGRPLRLKEQPVICVVQSERTRDLTSNLPVDAAIDAVRDWLGGVHAGVLSCAFTQAHLYTTAGETQWLLGKRGRQTLLRGRTPAAAAAVEPAPAAHDRAKRRFVEIDRPFLAALGVTDAQHRLVPAMARKWKQINKFVEVLDHAFAATDLAKTGQAGHVEVLDFGSGKGYLTFATHDHLRHALGLRAQVTGVELRSDLVTLCNAAAAKVGAEGLRFEAGDVSSRAVQRADIMIALHACDTATDHAIHTGIRAGASIILCSPCCHKELRPQLLSPHPLRPVLKHGVHLGQQAEMLTDSLRAMLLDACGYDTQVFEFVALEHTSKNKMILAVRRAGAAPAPEAWDQIDEVKRFYGIRDQCLETLLRAEGRGPALALTGRHTAAP